VVGLCSAYYLAQSGLKVTVLERGRQGHDCCSLGNAGMVVPSHFEPLASPGMVGYGMRMMLDKKGPFGFKLSPDLIRWGWLFAKHCTRDHVEKSSRLLRNMNMASRDLYLQLSTESNGGFGIESNGLVMLCRSEKTLANEARVAEHAKALGIDAIVLSAQDVKDLEINTKLQAAGAVHFRDDCHLNPGDLMAWLTIRLKDLGVEFRYDSEVAGVVREADRIKAVSTKQGEIEADEFVLAAGTQSGRLAKEIGFSMPMQGGKGYSVNLPITAPSKHCFILVEARIAVTPMNGSVRFAGTMEIVGDDLSVNTTRYRGLLESIPHYMPEFQPHDFEGLGVWSGLRPCSADGLPYLGRAKSLHNLIVATGHSMMGVSLAPITGKIVSQLANGQTPDLSVGILDPERFN
jgi:D-amino-acid dehydrogenase